MSVVLVRSASALALVLVTVLVTAAGCKRDERTQSAAVAPSRAPAAAAGNASTGKPMAREYHIQYFAHLDLPPATVTAEIPASWKETLSRTGAPSFAIDGFDTPPMITAIRSDAADPAARIEEAMTMQYGDGTSDVTRTALDGGRVWAVRHEANVLHARMFLPAPNGVVMAVALIPHAQAGRLAELKSVFETVRVQGGP